MSSPASTLVHVPKLSLDHVTNPTVLALWLSEVRRRSTADPTDVALLERKAGLLRALGDREAALQCYEELTSVAPGHALAKQTVAVLNGSPEKRAPSSQNRAGPAPFLEFHDLFTGEEQAKLWSWARQARGDAWPAMIRRKEGEPAVDPALRRGWRLSPPSFAREWFTRWLTDAVRERDILPRLGLSPCSTNDFELHFTGYGMDGHFSVHRDNQREGGPRRLTFVYYFHRTPKRFCGGDLLLFDEPSMDQRRSSLEFTRITPAENSLLLFPSDCLHAVTPVSLESEDRLDGRLTLNGWLHAA